MNKKAPWILLLFLLLILIFILGVRYGQKVEQTNEAVSYYLTVTPQAAVSPTSVPLKFATYKNKFCGIEFTYPNSLSVKETTSSAAFMRNNEKQIEFDCTATTSSKLKNKKVNNLNGRVIYYEVAENLALLWENTLKFTTR